MFVGYLCLFYCEVPIKGFFLTYKKVLGNNDSLIKKLSEQKTIINSGKK